MMQSFDLTQEPWLGVREESGTVVEVSIRDCFARSAHLRGLVGEIATQEAALLRLLIAILYRALPAPVNDEERRDLWALWWESGTLPLDAIDAYLDCYRERFDLLHPTTPFMQVADLAAAKTSGLGKLIADVPPGEPFFTTRAGRALGEISLAEAARWVVHCHAYDPSGIKTGAVGDPRVKGGKGYPIGIGWAGWCGLVLAEGASLRETLLLNLVLGVASTPNDRPVWERPPDNAQADTDRLDRPEPHAEPEGPADLLTWQPRRLRLFLSAGRVTDALISNGDAIHPRNRQTVEPHSGFRDSANQAKQHGMQVYMPKGVSPERAVWRGLPSLLPHRVPSGSRRSAAMPDLPPPLLTWIGNLVGDGILEPDAVMRLRSIGMVYGSQSSTIAAVVDDAITLRPAVINDRMLTAAAQTAVFVAEDAVYALTSLAVNLASATGEGSDGVRERTGEVAYAALDPAYRGWLLTLRAACDSEERERAWQMTCRHIIERLGRDQVTSSGQAAWVGRQVRRANGGERHVDAGLASLWFRSALAKALPLAAPTHPTPTDQTPALQAGEEAS